MDKSIKIKHISTHDFQGGAAKSAYRIHSSLRHRGVETQMLVRNKSTNDPSVKVVRNLSDDQRVYAQRQNEKIHKLDQQLKGKICPSSYFKADWGTHGLALIEETKDADLLHLHWVSDNFLDYVTFFNRQDVSPPIVWRFPDMNPVTGGCHFSEDCTNFRSGCGKCPAIGSDFSNDTSSEIHNRKLEALLAYEGPIEFVATNQWMKEVLESSIIGKHFKVHTVYNSVDTDMFNNRDKRDAKSKLGLAVDKPTIMFAAFHLMAPRKGLKTLLQALDIAGRDCFQGIFVGNDDLSVDATSGTLCPGQIADSREMAAHYQAADIVVVPSLSDNLPNVILEAMSSGCVVVASDLAGIPEIVRHKQTGLLFQPGNSEELADHLASLKESPALVNRLSDSARAFAVEKLATRVETDRYLDIYQQMLVKA